MSEHQLKVVAVTGGSGQLGTLVLRRLLNHPNIEQVVAIDLQPPRVASPRLTTVLADVRDRDLAHHFRHCDALVHCAALVSGGASAQRFQSVNVDGGKNVFQAAVEAGVGTIVHMSSITAYGCVADHPIPIVEGSPRHHQRDFAYASSKYQLEEFLDRFEPQHPDVAISRIRANVMLGRNMPHLLGWSLHAGWIPNLGRTPLPLVWDEDVADLVILALHARARGAFNAAAEELLDADELAQRTGLTSVRPARPLGFAYRTSRVALAALGLERLSDPNWFDKLKGARLVASSRRARSELGWSPRYPTATAVVQRFRDFAPLGIDRRVQFLLQFWARSMNQSQMLFGRSCRINLWLDGRSGRDLTLLLAGGRLRVARGPQPNPTSSVILRDALFRGLLKGSADADREREAGRIVVEGRSEDWEVFRQLVSGLVARQRAGDAGAAVLRRLASFLTRTKLVEGVSGGGGR